MCDKRCYGKCESCKVKINNAKVFGAPFLKSECICSQKDISGSEMLNWKCDFAKVYKQ